MPGQEKLRPATQGKYGLLRKCLTCKSVHDGGVNERCSHASPHIIANYCAANHIDYPADLVKSRRPAKQPVEAPVARKEKAKALHAHVVPTSLLQSRLILLATPPRALATLLRILRPLMPLIRPQYRRRILISRYRVLVEPRR